MFYAYRTQIDVDAHTYRELQLHQFPSKAERDAFVDATPGASVVAARDIPARHMSLFREFGGTRRPDGGFWGVVDSGTN